MQIIDPHTPQRIEMPGGAISFGINLSADFFTANWLCLQLLIHGGDDTVIALNWSENEGAETSVSMCQICLPQVNAELYFPIDSGTMRLNRSFLVPRGALRKGFLGGTPADKKNLHFLSVTVLSKTLGFIEFYGLRFTDEYTGAKLSGEPLIDRFGQRITGEWENKVHSEEELVNRLRAEYERADGAEYPAGWSKWGGYTAKRFPATGFFRTEHDGRRRWLVDPDGYAFFSNGICYAQRAGILGLADEYTNLHEWLPDEDGAFSAAWSRASNIPQYIVRNGTQGANQKRMFNFARANLIRAFGDDWHRAYTKITAARLRRMGFNTVGIGTNDYFDERTDEFLAAAKIPYVVTFRSFPLTDERIFRDFPDVFSEEYLDRCREFADRALKKYVGDPYLVGYFVNNEPEWLFAEKVNLTERLLACEGCRASKAAFEKRMREKYGSITALNACWGVGLSSFSELSTVRELYAENAAIRADFKDFEREMISMYGRTVSEALRKVDPDHLNLGMRYARTAEQTFDLSLDFDVFSVNCYGPSPFESAQTISAHQDLPIIIGEWHVGALNSGLPAGGVWFCDSQKERAAACRYYMEQATQSPDIVGVHYFEYNDQPYFGRFDGECYQIGLIDVCGRPYREVCEEFASFAKELYPMLEGRIPATAPPARIRRA